MAFVPFADQPDHVGLVGRPVYLESLRLEGVDDLPGCRAVVTDAGDKVLRFRSLVGLHCGGARSSYPLKKFVAALSR